MQVEAEASTDARPREGFTPRKGAGLPLFGKSENYPAEKKVRWARACQFRDSTMCELCSCRCWLALCRPTSRPLFTYLQHVAGCGAYRHAPANTHMPFGI